MKEIVVAAKRAETTEPDADGWEPVEIPITDEATGETRILIANPPGSGQLAVFMATSASFSGVHDRVGGAINFLASLLNDQDHSYLVNRLFDAKDEFGAEHVTQMIEGLMEEWMGRDFESRSGSTSSRRSGGQKSTRRTPAST